MSNEHGLIKGFPGKYWGVRCWATDELNYCPFYDNCIYFIKLNIHTDFALNS